ncbi:MAG: hypothetical protein E6767_08835 [Dysgonomonas sp.]|nr:hypothetical protein [Dysgonomonas sp.]
MSKKDQHTDNDVYFLGTKKKEQGTPQCKWIWIAAGLVTLLVIIILFFILKGNNKDDYYFEPETNTAIVVEKNSNDTIKSYIERLEETINDVPMYVYIPHNAKLSLELYMHNNITDSSIICIMQAADIRGDNMEIVGDFVLKGNRLSRGIAKKGFCSIIKNKVAIGTGDSTPLLQESIDSTGYFFRQYPLVHQGELIKNTLKNKSIRRAIGIKSGKVIMVESRSNESLHDFAQALIDIGITDAITLVGSNRAYGWYEDENGVKNEYGNIPDAELKNISYIVWKRE